MDRGKIILKHGDTFGGIVELSQNSSSIPPENESEFVLSAVVTGISRTFTDELTFTRIAPGCYMFATDTSFWLPGIATWDIKIQYAGQVISVPHDSNMTIELRSGV